MQPYSENNRKGFTLTKEDFVVEYFTAGGHGGQNVQKTSTACRISHKPSGAVGISRDERSQPQNRKNAFERCTSSERFKLWCKLELARQETVEAEKKSLWKKPTTDTDCSPEKLLIEVKDENGNWVSEKVATP